MQIFHEGNPCFVQGLAVVVRGVCILNRGVCIFNRGLYAINETVNEKHLVYFLGLSDDVNNKC